MNLSYIIAVFSILGAVDLILGNKLGLGKEFEKGFKLFGIMAISMMGMIVIAPVIGDILKPATSALYTYLHIEPSVIPAMLLANDMGGAPLCDALAQNAEIGRFNGLVVSSMFGVSICFTIPVALSWVKKELHKYLLQGFLCGIVTVPIGCLVSGLMLGISIIPLLLNLIPVFVFSVIIFMGLMYFPDISIKIFGLFGKFIKILIIIGLALGIMKFLVGFEPVKGIAPIEDGVKICFNACVFLSGALPLMYIVSKLVTKPLGYVGKKIGINDSSVMGFCTSLITNTPTLELMDKMDKKGLILNSAFHISATYVFASHLAFTMAYDSTYVMPVIIGKLIAGITAVPLGAFMYRHMEKKGLN